MTAASASPRVPEDVSKERSMLLQKQMIAGHYSALARAPQEGRKVVYTFVPGNLTELLRSFDLLPVLPEINALQSGMRKLSGDYIAEAEKHGHSEDVCTYVKCDIGMLKKGNIGPTGETAAPAGPAAALLHRLLHVHEVVRTAAPGIRLPGSHAACAVSVRRPHSAASCRVHRPAAAHRGDSQARAGERPSLRRGPSARNAAALGAGGR